MRCSFRGAARLLPRPSPSRRRRGPSPAPGWFGSRAPRARCGRSRLTGTGPSASPPRAKVRWYEFDWTQPTVLVVGSEGRGLAAGVSKECEVLVSLPQLGSVRSLNVSVAAGIVLYEGAASALVGLGVGRARTLAVRSRGVPGRGRRQGAWGYEVRGAERRACRSGGRRSRPALPPARRVGCRLQGGADPSRFAVDTRTGVNLYSTVPPVHAGVAQEAEQLICNQPVKGSSPFASSGSGQTASDRITLGPEGLIRTTQSGKNGPDRPADYHGGCFPVS